MSAEDFDFQADFPHGLSCGECHTPISEYAGMAERLEDDSVDEIRIAAAPVIPVFLLICKKCGDK